MKGVFRKLQFIRNLMDRKKLRTKGSAPEKIVEEKWNANFNKPKHARFSIKSEPSYDVSLQKNQFYSGHSLRLGIKKSGCIAWVEAPEHSYRDHVISGALRIDARGGYGAGGIYFRMVDSKTNYSFLISNKGYFRLDALRNGMPFPLVGWTELPLPSEKQLLSPDQCVDFTIIAYGSRIVIIIQGRWAAEVYDSSIMEGCVCFAAASYEAGDPIYRVIRESKDSSSDPYTIEAFLESITIDSRIAEVSALYEKWRGSQDIDSKARLNLAETFAAMKQYNAAMVQLHKAWDTSGRRKTQKEFLFAGFLAQQLDLVSEAESYISQCIEMDPQSAEGKEALTEMAKIIHAGERYKELESFCAEAVKIMRDNPLLWNFLGHAQWNLKEYKKAAAAYDQAFKLQKENGIFAKNAANVYDVLNHKKDAQRRYIDAGRAFLQAENYNDLGLIVPKLLSLGADNWEARSLAGKWAFAVEDWKTAEEEFKKAEELRKLKRPRPRKDGAQVFLEALLLIRAGNRRDALPLLKEAVSIEKDFALFHFRLAENIFLLDDNPDDPEMLSAMNAALALSDIKTSANGAKEKDTEGLAGWINNFAAQVSLSKGNLDDAAKYLERAAAVLGNLPAVKVNQAVLFYLRGSMDKALEILEADKQDDPDGVLANCAGNLLVRSGRFEEANKQYRKAVKIKPNNAEYLCNRASCLIELNLFGEADELLAKAHRIAPGPDLLEMISYVAAKKGEFKRSEQACLSALKMNPSHAPSLLSLGWAYLNQGRHEDAQKILLHLDALRLDGMALKSNIAKGIEELMSRLDEIVYKTIECASCGKNWKILADPPPTPPLRLFAMPPDDLPAGSCPNCGNVYCISCVKGNLDLAGRFICFSCNRPLKLVNEGIKKLIHDWAAGEGLVKAKKTKEIKPGRGRKPKPEKREEAPVIKRGRGRPRKN